jgi:hypothetical protein
VPARVSPVDRIRAEIDQLFVDPALDLGDVIEEVARLGARLLLQATLEAEVTAFLGRDRYQRDPDAHPGHRNGHQPITVKTTSGRLPWRVPSSAGPTSDSPPSCWVTHAAPHRSALWRSVLIMTVPERYEQRYGQNQTPTAQAANRRRTPCNQTPRPRHATTANAKVEGAIEASPLVPEMTMLAFTRQSEPPRD